ncbi:MAG: hypothetical protein ACJ8AH_22930, partial [Stellaceae bacterium]
SGPNRIASKARSIISVTVVLSTGPRLQHLELGQRRRENNRRLDWSPAWRVIREFRSRDPCKSSWPKQ